MPFNHLSNKDNTLKTESQMRLELSMAGQMLDADTPIDVVQGLFEKLEILKMHRNLTDCVKYPIKQSGEYIILYIVLIQLCMLSL